MRKPSRPRSKARRPSGLPAPTPPKPTPAPYGASGRPVSRSGTAETTPPPSPAADVRSSSPTGRLGCLSRLWSTRRRKAALAGVLVVLAVLACMIAFRASQGSGPLPEGVAAKVGPVQITTAELERAVAQAQAADGFPTAEDGTPAQPGTDAYREGRRAVMASLVERAFIGLEATRCGRWCAVSPAEIAKARQKVVDDNFDGSAAAFASFMRTRSLTEADVTAILRQEAQQRKLTARHGGDPKVTLAQARAFYAANRDRFAIPETRRVSHILLATRSQAARLRSRIDGGTFAALARTRSLDTVTAKRGGRLPGVTPGVATGISEDFDRATGELEPGEISAPVRSSFGWHLIRVAATPRRVPPFTEIAATVRTERRRDLVDARLAKWRAAADRRWNSKTAYASADLAPAPVAPSSPAAPVPSAPAAPEPQAPQAPQAPDPTPRAPTR